MKKGFLTGLLLFGIFFGAGNLIFPPDLGKLSGVNFNPAILGFILSGVGLAIITLIIGTLDKDGYRLQMAKKISPTFSIIFLIILYLAIGPFFAIPRTSSVSFSVGIAPISGDTRLALFIYTCIYFALAYILALFPSNIVSSIGKILTPIFIALIIILILLGLAKYGNTTPSYISNAYSGNKAFSKGFIEGYNTLDAIASIAFSVIAINTLKKFTFSSKREYTFSVYIAGITAAILFSILYYGLGLLGNKFPMPENIINDTSIHNGVYIISQVSKDLFGSFGQIFLGMLVILTCFTTTAGLIVSVSEFFYETYPKISYKTYMTIFTLMSFAITNTGLNTVINISIPVLNILYPMVIIVVVLVILSYIAKLSKLGMQLTMYTTCILAILEVMAKTFTITALENIMKIFPFYEQGLAWLIPAILLIILSLILPDKISN